MYLRLAIAIGISLLTGAWHTAAAESENNGTDCFLAVYRSTEFTSLKAKVPPIFGEKASAKHLNDMQKPSQHEVRLLQMFHERLQPCRGIRLREFVPTIADFLSRHFAAMDAIYAIAMRGEITWGEANRHFSDQFAKMREEGRRYAAPTDREFAGNGSGFFVTADGYIVTNAHVIRDNRHYGVFVRGKELPLQLIDTDSANDLALIKIEARGQPIPIAAGPPAKGEDAAALGYPVADSLGKELKATFGKINALSGPRDHPRFLQTDTPIQPGSSGGPLLNMRGEVIGIVTASFGTAANARRIGALPQNVNYAVKAEYLVPLLQKNIPGKWQRGSGVRFGSTADLVRQREPSVVMIVIR